MHDIGHHAPGRAQSSTAIRLVVVLLALALGWWVVAGPPVGNHVAERVSAAIALVLALVVCVMLVRRGADARPDNSQVTTAATVGDVDLLARATQSVAHDLRNVFSVVNACAVDLYDEMHGRRAGALVLEILNATERGLSVTTELVLAGRGTPDDDRPVDLRLLTCELEPLLRRLATPGVQIDIDCSGASVAVRTDRTSVMQILMNLVDNAADAMQRSGHIRIEVTRGASPLGSGTSPTAVITVSDDGPGIPPEVLARVFDVGFSTKQDHHAGIGLAVVHSVVNRCHGRLAVESSPETGTTFKIEFPLAERPGRDVALVVVEQDRARHLLVEVLTEHEFDVIESADALDACDLLDGRPVPSMAVLDGAAAADDGLRQMASLALVPLVSVVGSAPGQTPWPSNRAEAFELLRRGRPAGHATPIMPSR